VESSASFRIGGIKKSTNLSVELQKEKVIIQRGLEKVRCMSWVFPRGDPQELIFPIRLTIVTTICTRLSHEHPFSKYRE
jgi:hypothetical protein